MRRVDPMEPGLRIELDRPAAEVAELCDSFNAMLDRLEHERRASGRRALLAQEGERRRLARELHDEVGQTLTGVVLQLEGLGRMAPNGLAEPVAQLQETARDGVEEVREIVRGLRPQALDEFGLRSALITLAAGVTERSGIRVRTRLSPDVPALEPEQDLAVYRVAQESLTNVARHAGAREAELALELDDHDTVVLRVTDDGRGIGDSVGEGVGLGGMRERALLVGGRLVVRRREAAGPRCGSRCRRMSVPLRTRILVADDHTVVRRGLRMVLDAEPDLSVVAEASDGIEAVERGLRDDVDLAVLDVAMPRRTGLQAARELARHRPQMRVLMLSMHDVEEYCFEALKAGASGYVLKTVADRDLVEACRATMRGESFLYPPTVRSLMRAYMEDPERPAPGPLSPREREVAKLVAEAHTTEQIAELLVISPRTVERHRENILAKLGMRDRVELTRWAIRHGLVEP